MNTSTEIEIVKLEIAALLEIDAAALARLIKKTRRGGWASYLDHLAAALAWAGAPRDPRGRPAVDQMVANVMWHSPRRCAARAAGVQAAIAACGGWIGQQRRPRATWGGRRAGAGRKPRDPGAPAAGGAA